MPYYINIKPPKKSKSPLPKKCECGIETNDKDGICAICKSGLKKLTEGIIQ